MNFNPIGILLFVFRNDRREAAKRAERWTKAMASDPALKTDILQLSGMLELMPERLENGVAMPDPLNGERLAYERGKQDLAKIILAMSSISYYQLNQLMEQNDEL